MLLVRKPEDIYQAGGDIENGSFHGRWHFSFGDYYEREFTSFGTLRVFNDDVLSEGAVWPLHQHREIEVVTYCAGGEFRHADEHGEGGVLKKGWVQHTTVGRGMWHSEINNRTDEKMRFIQMWFFPSRQGLEPSVEQKPVEKHERLDKLLPLVSPSDPNTLRINSDAKIFSSFLEAGKSLKYSLEADRGAYVYVVEGGPVSVRGRSVPEFGSAMVKEEKAFEIKAEKDSELLLIDVLLIDGI